MDYVLFWIALLVIFIGITFTLLFRMTLKNFETLNNRILFTIIYFIILTPLGAYVFSAIYRYRASIKAK